ncbi:MAG: hypothetical protein U1F10_08715 [Burkholderiales bacterium]
MGARPLLPADANAARADPMDAPTARARPCSSAAGFALDRCDAVNRDPDLGGLTVHVRVPGGEGLDLACRAGGMPGQ